MSLTDRMPYLTPGFNPNLPHPLSGKGYRRPEDEEENPAMAPVAQAAEMRRSQGQLTDENQVFDDYSSPMAGPAQESAVVSPLGGKTSAMQEYEQTLSEPLQTPKVPLWKTLLTQPLAPNLRDRLRYGEDFINQAQNRQSRVAELSPLIQEQRQQRGQDITQEGHVLSHAAQLARARATEASANARDVASQRSANRPMVVDGSLIGPDGNPLYQSPEKKARGAYFEQANTGERSYPELMKEVTPGLNRQSREEKLAQLEEELKLRSKYREVGQLTDFQQRQIRATALATKALQEADGNWVAARGTLQQSADPQTLEALNMLEQGRLLSERTGGSSDDVEVFVQAINKLAGGGGGTPTARPTTGGAPKKEQIVRGSEVWEETAPGNGQFQRIK